MMKRTLAGIALAVGITITLSAALAAGMYSQLPQVGASADSSGLVTIPAGPTALTGAEVVGADTNLSAGAPPQSVRIPMAALGFSQPWAFETHPTTASQTIVTNNVGALFVTTATAAKAGLSVQFPSSPIDNQRFILATDRSITGIGFSPNTGQSLNGGGGFGAVTMTLSATSATTTAGATSATFVYRLSNTTWYRVN